MYLARSFRAALFGIAVAKNFSKKSRSATTVGTASKNEQAGKTNSVMQDSGLLTQLIGREVVFDSANTFVYVGRLVDMDNSYFVLEDADVHDLRDTTTTRELYVVEAKRLGLHANRQRVLVRREEVASLSALDDVLA